MHAACKKVLQLQLGSWVRITLIFTDIKIMIGEIRRKSIFENIRWKQKRKRACLKYWYMYPPVDWRQAWDWTRWRPRRSDSRNSRSRHCRCSCCRAPRWWRIWQWSARYHATHSGRRRTCWTVCLPVQSSRFGEMSNSISTPRPGKGKIIIWGIYQVELQKVRKSVHQKHQKAWEFILVQFIQKSLLECGNLGIYHV